MTVTIGDLALFAVALLLLWYPQHLLKQGFPKDKDRVPAAVGGVFCLLLAFFSVTNLLPRFINEFDLRDIIVFLLLLVGSYFAGWRVARIGVPDM